jgi:nucleotide-binding universal stress UspA family protein
MADGSRATTLRGVNTVRVTRHARRILVAYDGTPSARRALQRAASMHREGDVIALIRVTEGGEPVEAQLEEACALLAEAGIVATSIAVAGSPARTICVTAERDEYDVIVVGRRNLRDAGQLLLGSVAGRVVSGAPCDVVVVT